MMSLLVILLFANVVSGTVLPLENYRMESMEKNANVDANNSSSRMAVWADAAYHWSTKLKCADQNYLCEETCLMVKLTDKANFRIYGVEPIPERKFGIVFPDGDSRHKTFHDGILILDPFPVSRFGHPILVFYVDLNVKISQCENTTTKGFIVGDSTCLQPLGRTYTNKYAYSYRSKMLSPTGTMCYEIVFLPLVHFQTDLPVQMNDRLQCFSDLQGFSQSCPELRPKSQSTNVSCDPLLTNRDCGFLENGHGSRCSTSQTCDYAVLLSGGWNRQLSDVSTYDNIVNMKNLLISHGYLQENIETFYANGLGGNQVTEMDEDTEIVYSSSLKSTMRNHIRTLCESEYCSDTLFIYLNSPVKSDGTSLLWDAFDNGMADESEIYTTRELMRDLGHCTANRVVVMADQSYGGALVAAAEARYSSLQNVIIFTSADEFNWNTPIDRLTKSLLRYQYNDVCLNDFKNVFYQTFKSPMFVGSTANLMNSTLVGGPCTGRSTSLNDPEVFKYRGCSLSPLV